MANHGVPSGSMSASYSRAMPGSLSWASVRCSARKRSRRAGERFGFTYEGTFRQHMIVKGENRDTAWFSILDSEWPTQKTKFERWLDPGNFGLDGKQRAPLG